MNGIKPIRGMGQQDIKADYSSAPLDLIDDLPTSKAPVYRDFIVALMQDVKEDGLDCRCRACQRIRRATRALEADMERDDA
jgi:hypothetical protein